MLKMFHFVMIGHLYRQFVKFQEFFMKSHASMNRVYRLVWSQALGLMVAVAENAKGQGKAGKGRKLVAAALSLAGGLFLVPLAQAGPTGGQVSAGAATIAQAGSTTSITQSSQNLAINWQDFSIGANESVRFNQPNTSAIALNRVIGQNPSQILGALSANGQVFVLNPNGVLFGAGAQVNVGGLVASTLSLGDADLMAGNYRFANNGSSAGITNQGTLTAAQSGYVALLAPQVINEGVISATLGKAVLAAGNQVTLNLSQGSLLGFTLDQGAFKALADNKQLIQADGGQVFMSAKAADALTTAMVNNSGIIEARTMQYVNGTAQMVSGTIELMSDMAVGSVNVGGTLDASAPTGGNGGFIETSAAHVNVSNDAKVTTLANAGESGTWLIDPVDYTIASSGGNMTGAALTTSLASGSVTIVSTTSTVAGAGNINVNDVVAWSANKLTLNAQKNININANLNASGTAKLALEYGQDAASGISNLGNVVTNNASVNLPAGTNNFTTKFGSNGAVETYTVITSLGGEGSATGLDLQGMKNATAGTNFALGSDIDATPTSGWNAGSGFDPITGFTGDYVNNNFAFFDGLGHTITNLFINRQATSGVGLFASTGPRSVLRNVGLVRGSISGSLFVGGLVGINVVGLISNAYNTGTVKGADYVGGLVGDNDASNKDFALIMNSYSTGDVTGTGHHIGGLVGRNVQSNTRIVNSYATGNVSGISLVGGLVGGMQAGRISNVYATGDVSGSSSVGGLTGDNYGPIDHAYSTGLVTGGTSFGGLVGFGGSNGVSSSYWDTTASTQTASNGGTGLTTTQMQSQASYVNWDFTNTWVVSSTVNNGYPTFKWQARIVPPAAAAATAATSGTVASRSTQTFTDALAGKDGAVASFFRTAYQPKSPGTKTGETRSAASNEDASSDEQFANYRLINGGIKLPSDVLVSLKARVANSK
jgi:filamentous hemagglutinin family protein